MPSSSSSSSPPGVGIQPPRARENDILSSRSRPPDAKETGVRPRRPDPKTASTGTPGAAEPGTANRTPPSERSSYAGSTPIPRGHETGCASMASENQWSRVSPVTAPAVRAIGCCACLSAISAWQAPQTSAPTPASGLSSGLRGIGCAGPLTAAGGESGPWPQPETAASTRKRRATRPGETRTEDDVRRVTPQRKGPATLDDEFPIFAWYDLTLLRERRSVQEALRDLAARAQRRIPEITATVVHLRRLSGSPARDAPVVARGRGGQRRGGLRRVLGANRRDGLGPGGSGRGALRPDT